MAAELKTFFSKPLVKRIAEALARAEPSLDPRGFEKEAALGLEDLELLDRGRHIANAMKRHLPQSYPAAIAILLRSLGKEHATDELVGAGMEPFFYLPHVLFVAQYGLEHFDLSLRAQYELTKRFSAEASIRAYIDRDPERTFRTFRRWSRDKNAHVRRLVSEGTRLRLPWASRVKWLDLHPERVILLLEELKDDPSTMVRRSVANNLNDLGKVHPELLVQVCKSWVGEASPERRALVEHALRHAVKRGDRAALEVVGFGAKPHVKVGNASFEPTSVRIGSQLRVRFVLTATARAPQDLLVDLVVHFVKASGKSLPKVFKLARLSLEPREERELGKTLSLAPMTTRRHYPGVHRVSVSVNGLTLPLGEFTVT